MISRADAPDFVKEWGRTSARTMGRLTAGSRMEPTFLIVGAQRCGTTSLFKAITAHPAVTPPTFHKGVHYFDINYTQPYEWYKGHFPMLRGAQKRAAEISATAQTGESSPYYMHHPAGASRIAQHLPNIKVIALLRDPVERAFSAYKHEFARGFETLSFEDALDAEAARLDGQVDRLLADPGYRSMAHQHQAYVTRGRYAEQIQRFIDTLGRDQVFVAQSEEFFADGPGVYSQILDFLGLPTWMPAAFDQHNARPSKPMPAHLRKRLEDELSDQDAALTAILGREPVWRRS